MFNVSPFSDLELLDAFHQKSGSTGNHLLILYSLVIGLNAKSIVDLGLGWTTRALRAAAVRTGGIVRSCDCDEKRFSGLLEQQDSSWKLYLGASEKFLQSIEYPFDFVMHDGAHDYFQVKKDLSLILPRMRTFGVICIHDTQQPDLLHDMLSAIRDSSQGYKVSLTNMPFHAGLCIIRVEEGDHAAIVPSSTILPDGRNDTQLVSFPVEFGKKAGAIRPKNSGLSRWLRWRCRKIVRGW